MVVCGGFSRTVGRKRKQVICFVGDGFDYAVFDMRGSLVVKNNVISCSRSFDLNGSMQVGAQAYIRQIDVAVYMLNCLL